MRHEMSCSLCGHSFDPTAQAACVACPLRKSCSLVCCPECGLVTVDTERSRLVQLATALVHRRREVSNELGTDPTLADVASGESVVVQGYCPGIAVAAREQLEAYGLTAGRQVVVLQRAPVTVIRVDHTELALEAELAGAVLIHP